MPMFIGLTLLLFLVALAKTRIQPKVIQKNGHCRLVKHELLVDVSPQHTITLIYFLYNLAWSWAFFRKF